MPLKLLTLPFLFKILTQQFYFLWHHRQMCQEYRPPPIFTLSWLIKGTYVLFKMHFRHLSHIFHSKATLFLLVGLRIRRPSFSEKRKKNKKSDHQKFIKKKKKKNVFGFFFKSLFKCFYWYTSTIWWLFHAILH